MICGAGKNEHLDGSMDNNVGLQMNQRQRGGTNDNENYNSIQRGDHDTTINRQKPNMNGERETDVKNEWGAGKCVR